MALVSPSAAIIVTPLQGWMVPNIHFYNSYTPLGLDGAEYSFL